MKATNSIWSVIFILLLYIGVTNIFTSIKLHNINNTIDQLQERLYRLECKEMPMDSLPDPTLYYYSFFAHNSGNSSDNFTCSDNQ